MKKKMSVIKRHLLSSAYDSIDSYARKTKRFDEYINNQAAGRDNGVDVPVVGFVGDILAQICIRF